MGTAQAAVPSWDRRRSHSSSICITIPIQDGDRVGLPWPRPQEPSRVQGLDMRRSLSRLFASIHSFIRSFTHPSGHSGISIHPPLSVDQSDAPQRSCDQKMDIKRHLINCSGAQEESVRSLQHRQSLFPVS